MANKTTRLYHEDLLRTKTTKETYATLCALLDNFKRVYYSRFGDGDIFIIMGRNQTNHDFNAPLAEEIRQSLSIEHAQFLRGMVISYTHEKGMTKGLFERCYYNDEMSDFIIDTMNLPVPMVFENSWFPNYFTSFYPLEMNRFLDRYIRPRRKMFIGSVPETEIRKLVGAVHCYIPIPRKNAYASIHEWWPEVLKHIDSVELVLPAAGMASRVISKRLWELEKEVHCIDLGSIVDAASSYAASRKWIRLKGHMINRILLPEFRDNSLSYWIKYGLKETVLFFRYLYYRIDPLSNIPFFPKARKNKPGPWGFKGR